MQRRDETRRISGRLKRVLQERLGLNQIMTYDQALLTNDRNGGVCEACYGMVCNVEL